MWAYGIKICRAQTVTRMNVLRQRLNASNSSAEKGSVSPALSVVPSATLPEKLSQHKRIVIVMGIAAVLSFALGLAMTLKRNPKTQAGQTSGPPSSTPSEIELHKDAIQLLKNGRAAEARSILEKLVARNPSNSRLRANLGRTYVTPGSYATALEHLKLAKDADGSIPQIWNNLGYVQMQVYDWESAEASFLKAIELDPLYPDPVLQLARLYELKKDWKNSLARYKQYLQVSPSQNADILTQIRERVRIISSLAAQQKGDGHVLEN